MRMLKLQGPIVWVPYPRAVARAQRLGRPMLLFYTTDQCEPCERLLARLEGDARCRELVEAYVAVMIHMGRATRRAEPEAVRKVKAQFVLRGYPTLIVTRDGTQAEAELLGAADVATLAQFLATAAVDDPSGQGR